MISIEATFRPDSRIWKPDRSVNSVHNVIPDESVRYATELQATELLGYTQI